MIAKKLFLKLFVAMLVLLAVDYSFAEDTLERLKRLQMEGDSGIVFYGIVKDQYGQPLPGVKISAGYRCFSLTETYFMGSKDISAVADQNGRFVIDGFSGKTLFIDDMAKDGYDYLHADNPKTAFQYDKFVSENQRHKPDKNNPVVFILRKKNQPGLVSEKHLSVIIDTSGRVYYVDLLKGFMHLEKWMKKIDSDMVLTVNTADNGATFNIDLKTTDNDSGLVCSDSEPFWAPDSGYQREISFTISKGQEVKKNVYFKGTKGEYGEIFARLEIQSRLGNSGLNFVPALHVNLEGSKNLEYDSKYTLKGLSKISGTNIELKASDEFKAAATKALMNARQKRELK